jgi:hypothetical protein
VTRYSSGRLTDNRVFHERSALRPGRFTPGTHWIGGLAGPRADHDILQNRRILPLPGPIVYQILFYDILIQVRL